MRKRFTWFAAVLALVSIGAVMACSTKYAASTNGLVIVPSEAGGPTESGNLGGPAMETFSVDLANGGVAQINNVNGPPIPGLPGQVLIDPTGSYAYVIVNQNPAQSSSTTGIAAFQIASDGKLASPTTVGMNPSTTGTATCVTTVNGVTTTQQISVAVSAPVVPTALAIDSAGKVLFVADVATSGQGTYTCNGTTVTGSVPVPGAVSVFTVNSGSLTEVAGSPFALPAENGGSVPSASALAVTHTTFPVQYAPCSQNGAPTAEDLYVTDAVNYVVLNYSVNLSTGVLTLVPTPTSMGVATGTVPSGVAVDPCNRFVYVANSNPDPSVSAYTVSSEVSVNQTVNQNCSTVDYSLQPVTGSPYAISPGDDPGPIAVDAYGSFLYVVATGSNLIYGFKIGSSNGSLSPLTPATAATGIGPNSIAIRGDDSFVFVANNSSSTLSEYAVVPATGALSPQNTIGISTFDTPSGVAVK